ncbi:MAG: D-alanine--D-alanine ligase [Candidatus Ozemobacter sibiricus]|jgi:D-alanine-D-alanine ligase|uniref:D-alanine--D-alanine ligase n=1 Tax=Candidatus Ozemobacter sibiricus TaxID=2268124 RepID=A0A367ZRK5_9BACT|nr:MAG: D-alanine--D-alanine ligase [Candidatus Ozemobacter sibiricus]
MDSPLKITVGVIFGGRSGEHEVSLVSAQSIIKALDPHKYEVVPIGISKRGTWLVGADPQKFLPDPTAPGRLPEKVAASASTAAGAAVSPDLGQTGLIGDPSHRGLVLLDKTGPGERVKLDVLFPVVHGTYGEDGTLQGLLEMADIPYVGCGVLASALGMDKTAAKRVFRDAGLPIGDFREFLRRDIKTRTAAVVEQIEAQFTYPCFVKPVNSGSSVGVSKAHDRGELIKALHLAARYDRKVLVEEFIDGRELEVSVLGNDDPIASVPGEIVPCNEFYDYNAKYIDNKSELHIPAELSAEQTAEIRRLAIAAFKALDCAGMARVDFFLDRRSGKLLINEVNTIPGFTSISMYPKLWEASGIPYPELVDRLIKLALERYSDKQESLKAVA